MVPRQDGRASLHMNYKNVSFTLPFLNDNTMSAAAENILSPTLQSTLDDLFGLTGSVFESILSDSCVNNAVKKHYLRKAVTEDCDTFLTSLDALCGDRARSDIENLLRLLKQINDVCFNNEVRAESGGVKPALYMFECVYSTAEKAVGETMPERIKKYLQTQILTNIETMNVTDAMPPITEYRCLWKDWLRLPISQILSPMSSVLKTYVHDPLRQRYFDGLINNLLITGQETLTPEQCDKMIEMVEVLLYTDRNDRYLHSLSSILYALSKQISFLNLMPSKRENLVKDLCQLFHLCASPSSIADDARDFILRHSAVLLLQILQTAGGGAHALSLNILGTDFIKFAVAIQSPIIQTCANPRNADSFMGPLGKILLLIGLNIGHLDRAAQDEIAIHIVSYFAKRLQELEPRDETLLAGLLFYWADIPGGAAWLHKSLVFNILGYLVQSPLSWSFPYAIEPAIKTLAMFFERCSRDVFESNPILKALDVVIGQINRLPAASPKDRQRKEDVVLAIVSICHSLAIRLNLPELLLRSDRIVPFLQQFRENYLPREFGVEAGTSAFQCAGAVLRAVFHTTEGRSTAEASFRVASALGDVATVELCLNHVDAHHLDGDEKKRNAAHYLAMRRGARGSGLFLDLYERYYRYPPSPQDIQKCFEGRLALASILVAGGVNFEQENSAGNTALGLMKQQQETAKAEGEAEDFEQFKRLEERVKKALSIPHAPLVAAGPMMNQHQIAEEAAQARELSVLGLGLD